MGSGRGHLGGGMPHPGLHRLPGVQPAEPRHARRPLQHRYAQSEMCGFIYIYLYVCVVLVCVLLYAYIQFAICVIMCLHVCIL